MTRFLANPAAAKVLVVESMPSLRSCVLDALKNLGFTNVTGVSEPADLLQVLETEQVDWVIASLSADAKVNGIHVLKLFTELPRFRDARVSFLLRDNEIYTLPLAFELGLLSFHSRTLPAKLAESLQQLMQVVRDADHSATLTSAHYLRGYLRDQRQHRLQMKLERSLLEMFPGSIDTILNLAEAQVAHGLRDEAHATLAQARLINPGVVTRADEIAARMSADDGLGASLDDFGHPADLQPTPPPNALGIERCLVIDPDSTVLYSVRQLLEGAGVAKIETFTTGADAWAWLEGGGQADLVLMEWRLTGLAGPLLIQRLRQKHVATPIVVMSSLVAEEDRPLVREMGVSAVVEKPFDQEAFFREVIWSLQQNRAPTEQLSLERKISQFLQLGNKVDAQRLMRTYLANPNFEEEGKLHVRAELAFYDGDFLQARDMAVQALKKSKESLELLNLLGKTLLKLGDFEAALKCLHKAELVSPKNVERLCRIASLHVEAGQMDAAEAALGKAKEVDAGNVTVRETEGQVALATGDVPRAAAAMADLESLVRMMAFMNNKAIAFVRCGRFEDGIQLYRSALAALPGSWSGNHDIVCYNLALALLRYSELKEALQELRRIKASPGSPLERKAQSLIKRVEEALAKGTSLTVAAATTEIESKADGSQKKPASHEDFAAELASISPARGEICCYRLFFAGELLGAEVLTLLKNPPLFRERQGVSRVETMKFSSGK